jgi:hypothetical protein
MGTLDNGLKREWLRLTKENARLSTENNNLREALLPFAKCEMTRPDQEPDHWPAFGKRAGEGWPTVGDFRRARACLISSEKQTEPKR